MVYALLLERLDRQVASERQVAAVFIAAGAKQVSLPVWEDERARFDRALTEEPRVLDTEAAALRMALGVSA